MQCPVEGCDHVMKADSENDDKAVGKLIVAGDDHFTEIGHPIDQSMTSEMKKKMTQEHMKKEE